MYLGSESGVKAILLAFVAASSYYGSREFSCSVPRLALLLCMPLCELLLRAPYGVWFRSWWTRGPIIEYTMELPALLVLWITLKWNGRGN